MPLDSYEKKQLGPAPLDSSVYDYNVRGWLLGANGSYVKDTNSPANYFGFDLGYDKTAFAVNGSSKSYTAAQNNGNIGGTQWKSIGDDQLHKYDFTYDAVNRLTGAAFTQLTNNAFNTNASIHSSINGLTYDANGNILTMQQKGRKATNSTTIEGIRTTRKGLIKYLYGAAGNKIQKTVTDNTVSPVKTTITLYLGASAYVNDTLLYIIHEEGKKRDDIVKTLLVYDYFIKDHLSNVRMVLTEQKDTSFYPAATLKNASIVNENQYYNCINKLKTSKI